MNQLRLTQKIARAPRLVSGRLASRSPHGATAWGNARLATRSALVAAPPAAVWAKLAAFDQLSSWVDEVDHSAFTTMVVDGVGAARRVQVGRIVVIETITVWKPEADLAYTVDGLPRFLGAITNRWHLAPAGGGTLVSVTSVIDPGRDLTGRITARLLAPVLAHASGRMLRGLVSSPWPADSITGSATTTPAAARNAARSARTDHDSARHRHHPH